MEFWEFLLQKEGDRSWLPLESSKLEILEGRYRVVARSHHVNTPVEIRIIHDATTEMPPVRRTQKRAGRTNKDGLVVIIPYTRLLPGEWELRCTSDLMAEMSGEGWQHTVYLSVQSEVAEEDWQPDWQGQEPDIAVSDPTAVEMIHREAAPPAPVTAAQGSQVTDLPIVNADPLPLAASFDPEPIAAIPDVSPDTAPSTDTAVPDVLIDPQPDPQSDSPDPQPAAISSDEADQGTVTDLQPLTPRSLQNAPDQDAPLWQNSSLFQAAAQASEAVVDEVFQALDDQEIRVSARIDRSPPSSLSAASTSSVSPTSIPPIRLRLGQDTYVIQRGQPLTLVGQAEHLAGLLTDEIPVSELLVRLYDPRTSRVLANKRQSLSPRRLPFPFSCQIALPEHYQTYLVLGEVVLYGVAPEGQANEPPILSTQVFTVTTDLHELLESIANDFSEPVPPPPASDFRANSETQVAFIQVPVVSPVSVQFRPAIAQPLPPQLHPATPSPTRKAPELPTFAKAASLLAENLAEVGAVQPGSLDQASVWDEEISTEASSGEEGAAIGQSSSEMASTEATLSSTTAISTPELEAGSASVIQAFDDADPIPDWYEGEDLPQWQQGSAPVRVSSAPEDVAFRSLNLQERFWARLQSLMADQELSNWLQGAETGQPATEATMASPANPVQPDHSPDHSIVATGRPKRRIGGLDALLAEQEVMAEDEWQSASAPTQKPDSPNAAVPEDLALPPETPVPMPQLELTTRELTAEKPFGLIIKLPNIPSPLFVKLWLRDRQNRSILEGPRWLMDFVPDGLGQQMIRTELTVPRGCLEVQVEAIAIEATTQRESNKTSLTRQVIPPDLSPLSLDELDL